jgi:hypothetical protein
MTLAAWARNNEERIAELEQWQSAALAAIVAGNGLSVTSTSANGVQVTFAAGSTNQSWFSTLTLALAMTANGTPVKRKQAIFAE